MCPYSFINNVTYQLYAYIYKYINRIWHKITHKGWYVITHRPTNQSIPYVSKPVHMYVRWGRLKVHGQKSFFGDVITAVNYWDQLDTNTVTLIMRKLQGRLQWKINLIWSHSMRVSWLAYELFSRLFIAVCSYVSTYPFTYLSFSVCSDVHLADQQEHPST